MKLLFLLFCFILVFSLPLSASQAKNKTPPSKTVLTKTALIILTRNTVLALNNANMTGNYATFRNLAAPAFRSKNNPARLAVIFTKIRRMKMDLSPLVLFSPVFTQKTVITKQGLLKMKGYFPTSPIQINFALSYQKIAGKWKLFGISVNPVKKTKKKK